MANPIIIAQSRALSALIAEINQKGGAGGVNLQELKTGLMDPLRGGNIMEVVGALRERLALPPKEAGGLADQAVRTRAENMARNLEAAWGKAGQVLDQQQKALLDEHRINIVREEILKAERDIQHQKNEYLSGLKIQQVKEEVRLKKQLSALTMQGKDPRTTRGMTLLEQQSFRSNLERQKIVAQQESEKTQLDLDLRAKKAAIEATFLLNKSTLSLVGSNVKLFDQLEKLNRHLGGTPTTTDGGTATTTDGGTAKTTPPRLVSDPAKRQSGFMSPWIGGDRGSAPRGSAPRGSAPWSKGQPGPNDLPFRFGSSFAPILPKGDVSVAERKAMMPPPTAAQMAAEEKQRKDAFLAFSQRKPGESPFSAQPPPPTPAMKELWKMSKGFEGKDATIERLSTVLIKTESMAEKREKIESNIAKIIEKIVTYRKKGLNFLKNDKSEAEGLTDELEEQIKQFKRLEKEQKKARRIRAKGGLGIFDDEAAQDVKLLGRKIGGKGFAEGWGGGMQRVKQDSETIFNLLGERLPVQLRDGLVTAMEAGLDGAQNIGDAMRAMAVDVLKMIRRAFLQRMVSNVVGALPAGPTDTSEQIGGLIRAQAGLFVPGSGSGDKVPIMAEPKEYVLNKNAVAALGGERALDNLNFNVAPRFGGRMALNEDPLSSRMSGLYYATGSPELDELLQKMREKEEERKAKKAEKRALWTSFATMLASAAVFKGMDVAGKKWKTHKQLKASEHIYGPGGPGSAAGPPIPSTLRADTGEWPKQMGGGVVRRYGLGGGYQAGGAVRGLSGPSSNTNNISINISTGSNNETGRNATAQQGGQDIDSDNGSTSKEFARRISDAVKRVIVEEQRVGGSLSPGARRR